MWLELQLLDRLLIDGDLGVPLPISLAAPPVHAAENTERVPETPYRETAKAEAAGSLAASAATQECR
jgi:hypothetical protein